jgi:CitB family two-component system response regulator MalR
MLGDKGRGSAAAALPKGLDRHTLKRICETIQNYPAQDFSADEIAHVAGITRVSVRKYLEFLTEISAVTMTVTYGTVGRPVHRYSPNPGFRGCMDKF